MTNFPTVLHTDLPFLLSPIPSYQNSDVGQKSLPTHVDNLVQNLTSQDLEKFEGVLAEISNTRTAASKAEWNLYNSIFFCMTITTTIGKYR